MVYTEMSVGDRVEAFLARRSSVLELEAKTGHASLVLVDNGLALARGISRLGEQHAVVSQRFFVFAHTAWLKGERVNN